MLLHKQIYKILAILTILKICLSLPFSSEYSQELFIPFIKQFLSNFSNPWEVYYSNGYDAASFPYHPFMLYILSVFYFPAYFFSISSILLSNFFFKLPIFLSDGIITYLLLKRFPNQKKWILFLYVLSPLIFYSSYIHSQLDLIPTAFILTSLFFLNSKKLYLSAIFLGLGLGTKLHLLLALPLVAYYIYNRFSLKRLIQYIGIVFTIYLFWILPYWNSEGFYTMVLANKKQSLLFDSVYTLGNAVVYLPVFFTLVLYFLFFSYKKINTDLLYSFIAIVYSVFVLLITPGPAWYLWMFPFLILIFLKTLESSRRYYLLFFAFFQTIYLFYFVLFYKGDYQDISFLGKYIDFKIQSPKLSNLFYTCLEASILSIIYLGYKFGVQSNQIYKKEHSVVIGIGGDSGSGKTTLLDTIQTILGERVLLLEGDAYHKWERGDANWEKTTHLDPKANYLTSQADQILDLKMGKTIYRGEYDHHSGKFTTPVKVLPRDFLIVCGLHPFYLPKLRNVIDLKVFIDTQDTLRKHWKIIRDTKKRGYSKEKILEQLNLREKDSEKHIQPQAKYADIIVHYFTEDEFELGNESHNPNILLKLIVNSYFHFEKIVNYLEKIGYSIEWNYLEDLQRQYFIFRKPIAEEILTKLTYELIPNMEEIFSDEVLWKSDYQSITGFSILYILSQVMQEGHGNKELF